MEKQYSTRPKQELNSDRYIPDGVFPSSVYAAMKQLTQKNDGSTFLFDGSEPSDGFIVGHGFYGVVYDRREFYSESTLETELDPFIQGFRSYGCYDGIGTWFDEDADLICIDPVNHVIERDVAVQLGIRREEKSIWDIKNKCCIDLS